MLALEPPEERHVMNLRNWINGNGCIARADTEYLTRPDGDLLRVSHHNDNALALLEMLVVSVLVWVRKLFTQPTVSP